MVQANEMDLMAEDTVTIDFSPSPASQTGLSEMSNLKLAIAKIRKVVQWTETMPQAQMVASQV